MGVLSQGLVLLPDINVESSGYICRLGNKPIMDARLHDQWDAIACAEDNCLKWTGVVV